MADIVCLGELLTDMTSQQIGVRLQHAFTFDKNAGGAPANVAAGCASLGASVAMIAKLGDDSFGRFLRNTLHDVEVDTTGVVMTKDYATQLAFVAIGRFGVPEFEFHVKTPAHEQLTSEDINRPLIEDALVLHFGSLTLVNEPARSATLTAVQWATDAGAVISFDVNYRKSLWPDGDSAYETLAEAVALCDIVKVNTEELEFITGTDDPRDGLNALLRMGPELASVTLGPEGCAFAAESYMDEVPGVEVPVVDTTGCGDAFVAGTLSWLVGSDADISDLSGEQILKMYRFANATAALAAIGSGAIASMPARDEVMDLLKHLGQ